MEARGEICNSYIKGKIGDRDSSVQKCKVQLPLWVNDPLLCNHHELNGSVHSGKSLHDWPLTKDGAI